MFSRYSVESTTKSPVRDAPTIISGESNDPVIKSAMTMPGSTAWLTASLIIDVLRRTKKTPGRVQHAAVTTANRIIPS